MARGHDILDDGDGAVGHGLVDAVALSVKAHGVEGEVTVGQGVGEVTPAGRRLLGHPSGEGKE